MITSKQQRRSATDEHRLEILRQEEIDRKIEEAEFLTGGHQIGSPTTAALRKPRHMGLTCAEEHADWLKDISRWNGEYLRVLADLERVHTFAKAIRAAFSAPVAQKRTPRAPLPPERGKNGSKARSSSCATK